jgi:hypothetical protein
VATGVELATAYVTLAVSTRGMERDIRRQFGAVERQAGVTGRNAGRAMGGWIVSAAKSFAAPLAAAFGVAAIASGITGVVAAASDLEQALGGTDAVFKKQAAGIKRTAEGAAQSLGLPKTAYLELATVLGAGLKNKGLEDFAGQTQKLIKLGADLAAQYGGSTQDAVAAISSLMRGETDPIEKYGIGINETAVNAELARKGLSKLEGAALDQAKAQARVDLLFKQSKDAMGAFSRESDTFAGKQARLSATWADIKTQVGSALLPALSNLGDWFLKKGVPAIRGFATFVTTKLIPGIGGIKDILVNGDFTGVLRKAFGWEEDSRPVAFLFGVRDAFLRVKNAATGLIDLLIKGDFTTAFRKAFGVEEDSALVDFLFKLRDAAISTAGWFKNELWPALKEAYEVIAPAVAEAFQTIREAFSGTADGAPDVKWREFGDLITQKVIPAIATLVEVWLPIAVQQFLAVKGAVEKVWEGLMFLLGIQARVASALLTGFLTVTDAAVAFLRALAHVPGFGWADTAADKLEGAAGKARSLKDAIDDIPRNKSVTIGVKFTTTGQVRLPNGVEVDMGVWKAREHGGPVRKGQPYVVGEKRPELFVPDQNGKILPSVPGATSGVAVDGEVRDTRLARLIAQALTESPPIVRVSDVNRGQRTVARVAALSPAGAS